jgi:uncharacterized membrane protein
MNRWTKPLLAGVVIAAAAHIATLLALPGIIMDRTMGAMEQRGVTLHAFSFAPQTTPQTQTVVRPSPDLAYSLCRYDFSRIEGPLVVKMAAWDGYSSLSFFDGTTNNFLTVRGAGEAREVRLHGPDADASLQPRSPTATGIVLIRRLAPTKADYDRAAATSDNDQCASLADLA